MIAQNMWAKMRTQDKECSSVKCMHRRKGTIHTTSSKVLRKKPFFSPEILILPARILCYKATTAPSVLVVEFS